MTAKQSRLATRSEDALRADARAIFEAALAAVDPAPLVSAALLRTPLDAARRIHIIAAGKAAVPMARAALGAIGDRIGHTLVVAPYAAVSVESLVSSGHVTMIGAGHPLPDVGSIAAAQAAFRMMRDAQTDEAVLVLLSGGGSALLAMPADGISLNDYRTTTSLLLACGASIQEVNCVRAHIDLVKGGGLARACRNAAMFGLLISDVVGDDPRIIASGPLSGVDGSFANALDIAARYHIADALPSAVRRHLTDGAAGNAAGPLPSSADELARVRLDIIGNNATALDAAAARAASLGYRVTRRADPVVGEAADAGRELGEWLTRKSAARTPACLIAGGETTVTLRGLDAGGTGGRSQEVAVAAAAIMAGHDGVVLIAAGTDGIDGPTDAAGGVVDGGSADRMRSRNIEPDEILGRHDAYAALQAAGDLVITGPTGTNVMDVFVALRRNSVRDRT
ncbi:MAG TPA: DUF4147 domain-containing protein [Longimicrobiales bacterium]